MGVPAEDYKLVFQVIGKNAVMGEREPVKEVLTHELGIIMEAVARPRSWPTRSWGWPAKLARICTMRANCATRAA